MQFTSRSPILMVAFVLWTGCTGDDGTSPLRGPYLGQNPPGSTATIFAPGVVSTGHIDKSAAITPDGREFFFSVLGDAASFIAVIRNERGTWKRPEIAPFSGTWHDLGCTISPDGQQLLFASERPLPGTGDGANLWVVTRRHGAWSEPVSLGSEINTTSSEHYPSVDRDGTLFFYRRGDEDNADWDIFSARKTETGYATPVRLGNGVNTDKNEFDPFIGPDGRYLLFARVNPEDGRGGSDLYMSLRNDDGTWSEARNLGTAVNSERWEFTPSVTSDGRFLFFSSNRRFDLPDTDVPPTYEAKTDLLTRELTSPGNGHADVYWIETRAVDSLAAREE